jgi:hypothetical protein
MINAL